MTFIAHTVPCLSIFRTRPKRAAQGRSGGGSGGGNHRLDGDLRGLLRERPDSAVNEVLFVPPSSTGRIVGVVPVASPIVGHLALARLAGGQLEMVNLAVMTLQVWGIAGCGVRGGRKGEGGTDGSFT